MFRLIIVIALWGIIHSLLASLSFKSYLSILGKDFMKFYRLLYNVFAVISFVPVLYLMVTLPDQTLYQVPSPWSYLMRAGQGISLLFLIASVLQTGILSFVVCVNCSRRKKKEIWSREAYIVLCGIHFTRSARSFSGFLRR